MISFFFVIYLFKFKFKRLVLLPDYFCSYAIASLFVCKYAYSLRIVIIMPCNYDVFTINASLISVISESRLGISGLPF